MPSAALAPASRARTPPAYMLGCRAPCTAVRCSITTAANDSSGPPRHATQHARWPCAMLTARCSMPVCMLTTYLLTGRVCFIHASGRITFTFTLHANYPLPRLAAAAMPPGTTIAINQISVPPDHAASAMLQLCRLAQPAVLGASPDQRGRQSLRPLLAVWLGPRLQVRGLDFTRHVLHTCQIKGRGLAVTHHV